MPFSYTTTGQQVVNNGSWDAQFTDSTGTLAGVTYTGNYNRVGNIIFYCINVDFDGYSNLGTGQYQFTLPFPSRQTFTSRAGTLHNPNTGAPDKIRTCALQILSLPPLPLGYKGW
jgi:hypothetical protein